MVNKITPAEYKRLKRGKSKFKNHRIDTPDGKFDSKAEYARWLELVRWQTLGFIKELRRQVRFPLLVNGQKVSTYIADYVYRRVSDNVEVVEDCKGMRTQHYLLKKRLMKELLGIEILETPAKRLARNRRIW